ncbi:GNAT family N-acetyltransferase [Cetobacterium sp.]|uniref:GNAT family N-acetyltransferase n=1 Tax=Cetobacterium sp. TaxID=2071632 RepID=UPI003EE6A3C8
MYKIEKLEWDTNHFGISIGNLNFDEESNGEINQYDTIFAKIETTRFDIIEKLENEKFHLKDILVIFSGENLDGEIDSNVEILEKNKLQQVLKLCENAFLESHFYKNPKLKLKKVNALYKRWVKNRFLFGEKIYIYLEKEKVLGFLLEKKLEKETVIDLIAVKKESRGKKIAEKLIKNFISFNKQKKMTVGTQLTNQSAIRLYERIGFKFEKSINIYHRNK